jgi:acyl carrier protein
MKPLLERVLGRSSRGGETPDPVARPATAAREGPAPEEGAATSGPADSRASVIQALRHHVAEGSQGRLRAREIQEDGQLFDRGYLDSFSYVEFLAFIEQTYGVRIDDSQLAGQLNTIAAMAEHILRERTSPTA